ncbi:MAG: penicillin-binding protein 2 [Spirochaetales bacterium]|jgi:penicillin-binding protein 2|nr:penicillin-binding protein 2 [Spirochaetales bacterium]
MSTSGLTGSRDTPLSKIRIYAFGVVVAAVFFVYSVHLFNLQVVNEELYQSRATQVTQRSIPIYAQRGEIFDRSYDTPVVSNIDSFAVDIIPGEVPEERRTDVYRRLAGYLGISEEEMRRRLPPSYAGLYQPVEVKSGLSLETITYLAEHLEDFPGVTWRSKPIRNYVEKESLAHVLGYVGDITKEELQILYNQGYSNGSVLGKSGIEKQYDLILRGQDGKEFRTVDVRGRKVGEALVDEVPPVLGKNIVLTIDRNIQKLCEKALGSRIGTVLVTKPSTGEVLALVSYPSFDPNLFYTADTADAFRRLSLNTSFPFLNRAIQSQYVPASTYKIILTTAILEDEVVSPSKTVFCPGYYNYGDRVFRCHKHNGHGSLALFSGLAESCDVYYYTMGAEYLGIDRIVDFSRRFGLGELTGIDIPGEIPGTLPSPAWKTKTYNARWVGGDTVNMSIGQGYLGVTPIQMANAVSMIVNKGTVYKPHILKEIRDPQTGELLERIEPEILAAAAVRPSTFEAAGSAMRQVITNGTARVVITTKAVNSAGKTGTGEVGMEDHWHSWFVANAPYDAPPEEQIVLVVLVEAANDWEWWAPKAANIILHGIFSKMNYEEVRSTLSTWYLPLQALPQEVQEVR